MKKYKFKKMLKKEKNCILKDRTILYPLILLNIIIIFFSVFYIIEHSSIENFVILNFSPLLMPGITLFFEIPALYIDIATDIKINKMYKKYKKGEDYNNCCKRFKKSFIIFSLICAIFALVTLLDYMYCLTTSNRPILSIKDNKEQTEYIEKYSSLFFDYYKCDDGRGYINDKLSRFEDPYLIEINGDNILLKKSILVENNVYIGLPSDFVELDSNTIKNNYEPLNKKSPLFSKVFTSKDKSIEFLVLETYDEIPDDEIESFLDYIVEDTDKQYGNNIEWGEIFLQTFGNGKKVGLYEYVIQSENLYTYTWFYSTNGKLIYNSFNTDSNKKDYYHDLFKKIEDTLVIIK